MDKFIIKDNRVFIKVNPVKSLMNSGLITDVINRGGQFVVDMNTHELTIINNHYNSNRKYVWWRGRGKGSRTLSNDFDCALVQIADEFTVGHNKGRLYIDGKCAFDNEIGLPWREVVFKIREAYAFFDRGDI